jgi:hypothetical protein
MAPIPALKPAAARLRGLSIFLAAALAQACASAETANEGGSKPLRAASAAEMGRVGSLKKPAADALPRILICPPTQWGWARDSAADSARGRQLAMRRAQQDYYRDLGFTHVTYGLDPDMYNHWSRRDGAWTYAAHGLPTGADSSLEAALRETAARGLHLIPQLQGPSHMAAFITWVDSTVSEFGGPAAFREWYAGTGLPHHPLHLDHVAALGDNPAADQFFQGQLDILARAWKSSSLGAPDYVHIGHDELGYDSVCYVKAGRTRGDPRTRSELVAEEIARRVAQVSAVFGDSVKIILYGDSFLPTDLGERYGMAGEGEDGRDGVLYLLRHRHRLEKRILVMPWNYLLEDGDTHYWSRLRYDKKRQIRLLDRLGFGYIPGTGEHGSGGAGTLDPLSPVYALGMPEKSIRCLLEWVRAARERPAMLRGWAHQVFEPFDLCSPGGLCSGFSAPVLAYAAWHGPPERELAAAGAVDYRKSRLDRLWIPGVHYRAP